MKTKIIIGGIVTSIIFLVYEFQGYRLQSYLYTSLDLIIPIVYTSLCVYLKIKHKRTI